MSEGVLIYPHQLFAVHPAITLERVIYLIEEPLYFSQYKFHKQKLVFHRASMKAYEAQLLERGHVVRYIEHAQLTSTSLQDILCNDGITAIHIVDVVDNWLQKKIQLGMASTSITVVWYETPQFLTSDTDAKAYWGSNKRHLQHDFYVWQRKRLGILFEANGPLGGKWSYDAENRKSLPKGLPLPSAYAIPSTQYASDAIAYVEEHFGGHYGNADTFSYAVTHAGAEVCLQSFLDERLETFGPYEDAITARSHRLFHSELSPYLNNGLLTPQHGLDAVLTHAQSNHVPLASLEGFVRQLVGWREFIRMTYVCDGSRMRNQNVLGANRKLTDAWWKGTMGIYPLDSTIRTLEDTAYSHHIIRLMVAGNMMTLLGIDPHEGYQWFMEWYIDAYDWVMVPNVYGMALFADGGTMVTKPYVSSSNYLTKMSDYAKGDWNAVWDALYWAFVEKHQALLSANARASFSVMMFNKFSKEKHHVLRDTADKAIEQLTSK